MGRPVVKFYVLATGQTIQLPMVETCYIDLQLDRIGEISIQCASNLPDLSELGECQLEVRVFEERQEDMNLLAVGIVASTDVTASERPVTSFTCPDLGEELRLAGFPPTLHYQNVLFEDIAQALITYAPGWTVSFHNDRNVYCTLDLSAAATLFDAFIQLNDKSGNNLFVSSLSRTLELGQFGDASGVDAFQPPTSLDLTDSLSITASDTAELVGLNMRRDCAEVLERLGGYGGNYALPEGTVRRVQLDYAVATESDFPIDSAVYDTQTYYWVENAAVTTGSGGRRIYNYSIDSIVPVEDPTLAEEIEASQALYNALVAELQRHEEPAEEFDVVLRQVSYAPATYKPGNHLAVTYFGENETIVEDGIPHCVEWLKVDRNDLRIVAQRIQFSRDSARSDQLTLSTAQARPPISLADELTSDDNTTSLSKAVVSSTGGTTTYRLQTQTGTVTNANSACTTSSAVSGRVLTLTWPDAYSTAPALIGLVVDDAATYVAEITSVSVTDVVLCVARTDGTAWGATDTAFVRVAAYGVI